ncbi:hypothetical protein [Vulgatibacter sp.]|uniref:hypothetical protein n=1 Tax=Vulgatibacter sp. TaxID=1971226 RepID=UPI00356A763A
MLRMLAAAALATSVVAVAAPAEAQENTRRPMGLRFELGWNESFNLATFGSGAEGVEGSGGASALGAGLDPTGDIKIGYDIGQFTPLIGLSFLNRSVGPEDEGASLTAFVIDVEGRFYLAPHRKGLQPFIFGEFNTGIVSYSTDADDDDELEDAIGDALDWTEINAGLGMEYKFDGAAFAIGGKWGLGLAFRGLSDDTVEPDGSGDTTIGTLGAIYAAWRI